MVAGNVWELSEAIILYTLLVYCSFLVVVVSLDFLFNLCIVAPATTGMAIIWDSTLWSVVWQFVPAAMVVILLAKLGWWGRKKRRFYNQQTISKEMVFLPGSRRPR
jgi:membrane protein implicated in regulation of membrane protease activity